MGPLKFWVSSADALVCISLFKYKCFHAFSSDRIGWTVLLADRPLPACTSVQIRNQSWRIGWWYYLSLSLGETAGEGKWVKTEPSWDSYFWKQWGRRAPGVGKCRIIPTEMKKKPVKWLFQITATAISFTLHYPSFSTGNTLFFCPLLPMYFLLILQGYKHTFRGKPLIILRKTEERSFRYFCVLFVTSPLHVISANCHVLHWRAKVNVWYIAYKEYEALFFSSSMFCTWTFVYRSFLFLFFFFLFVLFFLFFLFFLLFSFLSFFFFFSLARTDLEQLDFFLCE